MEAANEPLKAESPVHFARGAGDVHDAGGTVSVEGGTRSRPAATAAALEGTLAVRVLRSTEALAEVRTLWTSLQRHPWSDLDYFLGCVTRQAGFVRPHVLVLSSEGRDVALVVARLSADTLAFRLGTHAVVRGRARVLRIGTGGILGADTPAYVEVLARALGEALADGEADALYLHEVDSEVPLRAALGRYGGFLQRDRFARAATGWVLELSGSFQEFRQALSKKARTNLNYTLNLVQRRLGAGLSLACYRRPEELERLMRDSEAVAGRTYHRRAGVGFEDEPETRRVLAHALAAGWLRAHVLYDGARPIAYGHGLAYGGTFYGRHTGFDPEYGELRPGAYLMARVIEDLCAEGAVRRIDFGVMDGELKRSFGTRRYERVSSYLFAPRPRGVALALARNAVGAVDHAARSLLGAARARRLARKIARPEAAVSAR